MRTVKRWGPACLALIGSFSPVGAQPDTAGLLRKAAQLAATSRTLQAEMVYSRPEWNHQQVVMHATVRLLKPNLGHVEYSGGPGGAPSFVVNSDGKRVYLVEGWGKQFRTRSASSREMPGLLGSRELQAPIALFFDPNGIDPNLKLSAAGEMMVEGKRYWVVDGAPKTGTGGTVRYFIGPGGLLEGVEMEIIEPQRRGTASLWLKKIQLDTPMAAAQFAYTPPAGFSLAEESNDSLLAVGAKAPEFRLPELGGGDLALAGARRGKKAVLINFWFYGCGPCREELPRLQRIYEQFREKGLELIAVNAFDSEDVIRKYVTDSRFSFRVVMDPRGDTRGLGQRYHVAGYPTNYLLDAGGVIVWRSTGFDETALREALARLDIK